MNAGKRTLGHVFEGTLRLAVPLFQRPYSWKEDPNWELLWDDMRQAAERRVQGQAPRLQFLGTIVLDQVPTKTGDVETRQVIDGQQRLTTLQLALAAFRDQCKSVGLDKHAELFRRLTANDLPGAIDSEMLFKVWPTDSDRSRFQETMTAEAVKKVRDLAGRTGGANGDHHLIPKAYLYFSQQSASWLGADGDTEKENRASAFLNAVKQDMVLVVIDLDQDDDAQVIFETLNARGTPLLPADLVKNFLLHLAMKQRENIQALYERHWRPLDADGAFWRAEVRQGRLKRPRLDLFLQHYLTLKTGEEVNVMQLYGAFRDFISRSPDTTAAQYLTDFRHYADVFRKFTEYPPDARVGLFFHRLHQLDTTTVLPLLLDIFHRVVHKGLPEADILPALADLESFLVRRTYCGMTTKNYNKLFLGLVPHVNASNRPAEAIRKFLLAETGDSTKWPTDEEFRRAWAATPIYLAITRPRLRMILEALDLALFEKKTERVHIKDTLTVEHLLPQAWREHWPPPDPSPEAAARRDQSVNLIGNLTLLTDKLNPSLSNGPWKAKRPAILKHSALTLNRYFQDKEAWDEAAIAKRGEELFKVALEIWPRP